MNKHFWIKTAMALLILALWTCTALAQDQSKGPPPFPPPVKCLADSGYLYVLIGPSVYQYKSPDLILQRTLTLPAPEDTRQVSSSTSTSTSRPPMPPMLSMIIDGEYLYLIAPGYIFQYSLPDLELVQKQALPKPEALK
jgi:hypothetical protein